MNPTRIRAENFRTYPTLDLQLPNGCVGIVGANGAGKSSIPVGIDVCLFGPEHRSLEEYLSADAIPGDALMLELELEHADDLYRIRRTFTSGGRGKSTCDFARRNGEGWTSLTQGDQRETQSFVERTFNTTRHLYRNSVYMAQGEPNVLTDAPPKEKKGLLSSLLDPTDFWPRCKEMVSTDRRARVQEHMLLVAAIARDEAELAERAAIQDSLDGERMVEQESRVALAQTTDELAAARDRLAQLRQTAQAREAAQRARGEAERAHARIVGQVENLRIETETLERRLAGREATVELAGRLPALQAERDALSKQKDQAAQWAGLIDEAEKILHDVHRREARAGDLQVAAMLARRITDRPVCDRCERPLDDKSAETTALSYEAEATGLLAEVVPLRARLIEIDSLTDRLPSEPPDLNRLAELHDLIQRAQHAQTELAAMNEVERRLEQAQVALAAAREELPGAVHALTKADADLARLEPVDETMIQQTRLRQDELEQTEMRHRRELEQTVAAIARYQDRLARLDRLAANVAEATEKRDRLAGEVEELQLLERAFGRDGVPTWILETSAIPSLELEADRLLTALGTDYRVELRTERELKGGGSAETLDVILLTPSGARDYSTFSGGERTRLNLALRLALARLLAHRRGAESRALIIDEPEFLDQAGTERLVEALRGMDDEFDRVLLVSHVPALRDAFDVTMSVTKTDGRSAVVVA